jgi:hypothetical protein
VRVRIAVLVLLAAACNEGAAPPSVAPATTTAPPVAAEEAGLFSEATGHLLVFDDGYDGVLVVDPDRRIAMRRVVQGQTAGDQMPRLHRTGDDLIVGWGGIWAAPVDGGPSRLLSQATIAVPAAEPDRVWTVDYPEGHIGGGDPVVRLLEVSTGESLVRSEDLPAYPVTGIPGGLALQTEEGVGLWDPSTGRITEMLGNGSGFPADAQDDRLAWCAGNCPTMHVTDLDTGEDHRFPTPDGDAWYLGYEGQLSPDGRFLATSTDRGAVVIDIDEGTVRPLGRRTPDTFGVTAWAPDGTALYWFRDVEDTTRIGRLDMRTGTREVITVDHGRFGGSPVVLDAAEAPDLVIDPTGSAEDCGAPNIQPSGRGAEACAYRLRTVRTPTAG